MILSKKIDNQILELVSKKFNISDLKFDEEIQLSSIEILKMVTLIEKKYGIEVEDKFIFHGLFSSCKTISSYIYNKIKLSDENNSLK
ncbi:MULTISPECIES: hypothetical protein [Clostridium]|uniref:hypothetical protein n=1 Tax=Clostridium TaxID=1485 RepID=UPI000824B137|nr:MULTISPECIES: hypothetical protein [Clostridium]PJI06513.1 hypothetical protein CUB90_00915 [Clostridium sp. CT7]